MPLPSKTPPYTEVNYFYPPEHPHVSSQFIRGLSRGQGDLHCPDRLFTLGNNFNVPNHVPRPAVSTFNEPHDGRMRRGFVASAPLPLPERSSSAPGLELGQFCPYEHPVSGKRCGIWYGAGKTRECHKHIAQHYIEEAIFRAQCTLALSEEIRSRASQVFREVREVQFVCGSCGRSTNCQTDNVARLFLHNPELSSQICQECSVFARRARPSNSSSVWDGSI